jgi:PIN domain nuclease of toxin-antitoxin system
VRARIESEDTFVSPVVELELTCLYEVERVTEPAGAPLQALARTIGLEIADAPMAAVTRAAVGLSWTRDPFDRLIAAHAIAVGAPLLTADRTILEHLPLATWS